MKQLCLLLLLCAIPTFIMADGAFPLIFFVFPPIVLVFPAVVILEAYILRKYLNITKKESYGLSSKANLISTFLGIPLLYVALFLFIFGLGYLGFENFIENILVHFVFLGPGMFKPTQFESFLTPVAADKLSFVLTFLVSSCMLFLYLFFMTWLIECFFIKRNVTKDSSKVSKAVFYANVASYLLLFGVILIEAYLFFIGWIIW